MEYTLTCKNMLIYNKNIIKILNGLKVQIRQNFDVIKNDFDNLRVSRKADNSIVTEFDLYISSLFKQMIENEFPLVNFYSEEDMGCFKFPVCILDPIDGTKEFAAGMNECAVSFGIYFSEKINDERNFSWIYNPVTSFEISSIDDSLLGEALLSETQLNALVSRTEYEMMLHRDTDSITYKPKGSIAYKLALLASGKCDVVITKKDKNIWDILAGTHICMKNNIFLYQNNKKVSLITDSLYKHDMIWCSDELIKKIVSDSKK